MFSEELPSMDVWDVYKEIKSVQSLYVWQRQLLEQEDLVTRRRNYILWIPTGAGKTLVAELLLIREAIMRKRNCLFILPYVAIVQEKISSLVQFEDKMDIIIEEYAASKGRFPPIKRRNAQSIYVCTIEKANHLANSLIENGRLNELGLAIVDELHMIGESGGRGAILEQCLCKLMHSSQPNGIQIVGMSATIGNPIELCKFLSANKFCTSFRPVKLVERIKVDERLYQVNEEGIWIMEKQLPKMNRMEKRDPDGLSMLLGNLMKGQVLIFCPTKENCENLCKLLASLSPIEFREHRAQERQNVVSQLQEEHEGRVCPILCAGIMHGVAYHHSGLTQDERLLVETAYRNGTISIICCTSTLAAGVNLPARRVIIRSPYVGRSSLRKTQYLQMIGRAGRAGLDEKGDSIIILHQGAEITTFKRMHSSPLDPSISGLCDEQQREAFFLDLIVLKICSSIDDLHEILHKSLFGIQFGDNDAQLRELTEKTVQSLLAKNMLKMEIDRFLATQIGTATFNAHLNPQMALMMNKDLEENLFQGIILSSHFHLLYNCIPLDIELQNLDWNIFHNEYLTLSREEQHLVNLMGLHESTILHSILSSRGAKKSSLKAQRLYAAFMLRKIWNQQPLWEVAQHYHVPRGWLQSLLQSVISQSTSIVRFAERMPPLWSLKSLLPKMVKHLSECSHQELIPLLGVDCIKMGRARQLYEQGYRCVGSIARATALELIAALGGKLSRIQANRMINNAKTIIRDQIAEKTEELEQLVSGNNTGDELFMSFSMSLHDKSLPPSQPTYSSHPSTTMLRLGLEPEAEEDDEYEEESTQMSNSPSSGSN